MNDGKGYKLPLIIDPGGVVCMRAYLPNDAHYIMAWWGCYEYLTTWLAWERDGTTRGRQAGDLIKPLFVRARDEWLTGDGACQVAPDMTMNNAWEVLLDFLWGLKTLIDWVDAWLDAGESASEIKSWLVSYTERYPALPSIIDSMASMTEAERQAAIDAWDWLEMAGDVWCNEDCELIASTTPSEMIAFTQCAISKSLSYIMEQAGSMADWFTDLLSDELAYMGFADLAGAVPNGGDLFGFTEPSCEWSHVFDFTLSDGGWEQTPRWGVEWQCGVWVDGVGWVYTDTEPDLKRRHALIRIQFPRSTITSFRVNYTLVKGTFGGNAVAFSGREWDANSIAYEEFVWWDDLVDGTYDKDYISEHQCTELEVWVSSCRWTDWDGYVRINKITVFGTGLDPFV